MFSLVGTLLNPLLRNGTNNVQTGLGGSTVGQRAKEEAEREALPQRISVISLPRQKTVVIVVSQPNST